MENIIVDKDSTYIKLQIGTEFFAIGVEKVLEILQFDQLIRIPDAPDFLKGVINYRDTVVPVIDMYKRFNIESNRKDSNMIIVVSIQRDDKNLSTGLLVDEVMSVVEFNRKNIRGIGDWGIRFNSAFLEGFAEVEGQSVLILNVDNLLNVSELSVIEENEVTLPIEHTDA